MKPPDGPIPGPSDPEAVRRLVNSLGDDFRYCQGVGWLHWSGSSWRWDKRAINAAAKDVAQTAVTEAVARLEVAKADLQRAKAAQTRAALTEMIAVASADPRVRIDFDRLVGMLGERRALKAIVDLLGKAMSQ